MEKYLRLLLLLSMTSVHPLSAQVFTEISVPDLEFHRYVGKTAENDLLFSFAEEDTYMNRELFRYDGEVLHAINTPEGYWYDNSSPRTDKEGRTYLLFENAEDFVIVGYLQNREFHLLPKLEGYKYRRFSLTDSLANLYITYTDISRATHLFKYDHQTYTELKPHLDAKLDGLPHVLLGAENEILINFLDSLGNTFFRYQNQIWERAHPSDSLSLVSDIYISRTNPEEEKIFVYEQPSGLQSIYVYRDKTFTQLLSNLSQSSYKYLQADSQGNKYFSLSYRDGSNIQSELWKYNGEQLLKIPASPDWQFARLVHIDSSTNVAAAYYQGEFGRSGYKEKLFIHRDSELFEFTQVLRDSVMIEPVWVDHLGRWHIRYSDAPFCLAACVSNTEFFRYENDSLVLIQPPQEGLCGLGDRFITDSTTAYFYSCWNDSTSMYDLFESDGMNFKGIPIPEGYNEGNIAFRDADGDYYWNFYRRDPFNYIFKSDLFFYNGDSMRALIAPNEDLYYDNIFSNSSFYLKDDVGNIYLNYTVSGSPRPYGKNKLYKLSLIDTHIDDISYNAPELKLYPNPAVDELHYVLQNIELAGGKVHIQIFDLSGKLLIEHNTALNEYGKLNIARLSSGVYIFNMNIGERRYTQKFLTR